MPTPNRGAETPSTVRACRQPLLTARMTPLSSSRAISEVVASGRIRSGYGGIREPWNAEYIALMQPTVGAALANWLELEADDLAIRIKESGADEYAIDLEGDHALIVARLINGEEAAR